MKLPLYLLSVIGSCLGLPLWDHFKTLMKYHEHDPCTVSCPEGKTPTLNGSVAQSLYARCLRTVSSHENSLQAHFEATHLPNS